MSHKQYENLNVNVIEVGGSYQEMGLQEGRSMDRRIHVAYDTLVRGKKTKDSYIQANKALQKFAPYLLEEIGGLAEGIGVPLEEAVHLYSGYDFPFPDMGCTTLIHDSFYVRNYDFGPDFYDARFVFSNPKNGYASVGFSGQIIGRLDGMNEKGLVAGLHFVNNKNSEKGFIATTIVRSVLDQCSDTEEAIKLIEKLPHGFSYNYSLTDRNGNSAWIEASPRQQRIQRANTVTCTNHFSHEDMSRENRAHIQNSLERKDFLCKLSEQKGELTPLKAYHQFNDEESPLFYKQYQQFFGTLHTVVYLPRTLEVIVGIGGNSDPVTLSLKDWLEGSIQLPDTLSGRIQC